MVKETEHSGAGETSAGRVLSGKHEDQSLNPE